jgi:hypothetical protein
VVSTGTKTGKMVLGLAPKLRKFRQAVRMVFPW